MDTAAEPPPDDLLLSEAVLRCDLAHWVTVTGPWMPVMHRALSDKLYAVTGGTGWLTLGQQRYRLRPGRVYAIPAGTVHAGESDARRPLEKGFAHFRAVTAGSMSLLRVAPPPGCVAGATARAVTALIERMEAEWTDRPHAYGMAMNALLGEALLTLYRAPARDRRAPDRLIDQPAKPAASDAQYDTIKRVLAEVLRGYAEPLDVPALADAVGWTPGHLSRVFHRLTGVPPRRYIESVRMNRARQRLAGSDEPVAEIARAVGYDDPAYFSRAFQRAAGVSPTVYRASTRPGGVSHSA
ncbi:MAG: AraC family transcriptional regulator [Planctomycetota bacterium]